MTRVSESSTSMGHLQPAPNTREAPPQGSQPSPAGTGGLASRGATRARKEQPEASRNVRPRQGDLQVTVPQTRMAPLQFSPIRMSPGVPSPSHATPLHQALMAAEAKLIEQQDLVLSLQLALRAQAEMGLSPVRHHAGMTAPEGVAPLGAPAMAAIPPADAALVERLRTALQAQSSPDIAVHCGTAKRLANWLAESSEGQKRPGGLEALRSLPVAERQQIVNEWLGAVATQNGQPPLPGDHPLHAKVHLSVQLLMDLTQAAPAANPQAQHP